MAGFSTYQQSDLYELIDGNTHQKFAQVNDRQVIVNRAVRQCLGEIDFRSTKRSAALSPNLFNDIYEYTAPSDLKGEKIIDIRRQVKRPTFERWALVDDVDFDRYKGIVQYKIALRDENGSSLLRIDGTKGTRKTTLHECNSLTTNGTVTASADASNLTIDTDNYISGGSAINFDMAAGATTGAVTFTDITDVDLTEHDEKSSIFVWVFIPDYSDAQGDTVTNFILRWGNSASVYWERTVTVNNEGNTFHDGWNLIRFDWNGATETGTVNPAQIDFLLFTVTKSTSLAADTDWRIDAIISRVGEIYDTVYYSKFGWQNSGGTYIEESTATTDNVFADTDELEILGYKASEMAAQELKEKDDTAYFRALYLEAKKNYDSNNPSEALKKYSRYANYPRLRRGRRYITTF